MTDERLDPLSIRREIQNLMLLMTPRELAEMLKKTWEIIEREKKQNT